MLTNYTVTAAPSTTTPAEIDPELARRYLAVLEAGHAFRDHLVVLMPERKVAIHNGIAGVERSAARALAAAGLHPTARPDAEEVTR